MQIASLFQKNRPVFSLEIFPPKRIGPIDTICKTLDNLKDLQPDFISVTTEQEEMQEIQLQPL